MVQFIDVQMPLSLLVMDVHISHYIYLSHLNRFLLRLFLGVVNKRKFSQLQNKISSRLIFLLILISAQITSDSPLWISCNFFFVINLRNSVILTIKTSTCVVTCKLHSTQLQAI